MEWVPKRLRARLLLTVAIAVLPALLWIAVNQSIERRRARQRALEDTLRLTRLAAGQQASVFIGARRFLETLAQFPGLQQPDECNRLLSSLLRGRSGYLNLGVVDDQGALLCSGAWGSESSRLLGDRAWFERARSARTTVLGAYQIGRITGMPQIVVAYPLLRPTGEVNMILVAALELTQLDRLVSKAQLPAGATLTLFDRTRTILARYPDGTAWIGQRMPEPITVGESVSPAQEDIGEGVGVDGIARVYATVPVDTGFDTGLLVHVGIARAVALAQADVVLWGQVGLLVLLSVAIVGGALVGGQALIIHPVQRLKSVTDRLASGDFSARAQLDGGVQELSALGNAVDAMATALETRQQERNLAQQQLATSEARYRLLFAENPHPMWVYDLQTLEFLEVNDAAVRHYEYSRDEFLGMRITDIRPPEDLPRLEAHLETERDRWMRAGTWRHRVKAGRVIDVDIASHTLDFGGRPGALVTAQDVTDRLRAQVDLTERATINALGADVGIALNRSSSLRERLQGCTEALIRHLDAAFARIWTLDVGDNVLHLQASAGLYTHLDGAHQRIPVGQFKIGRIARDRAPLLTNQVQGDPEVHDQAWATREGMVAFAGYPLLHEDRLVGVMALFARKCLSDAVMTALGSVADHIALGIASQRAEAERHLLASIVQGAQDPIFAKTLDGVILSWNGGAERLYGYTQGEAIGQSASLIAPADRKHELDDLLARLRRGEHVKRYETIRQRKDGSLLPVSLTLSPIKDATGDIIAASSMATDISDRVAAEQALRDTEERMRFALHASRVGVWEASLTSGVAYWSETCEALHGLAPGTFGKSLEAFMACVHPDDREEVLRRINEAIRDHREAKLDYRTVWPDGTERRISSTADFVRDETGNPTRGAGVAIDVTDQRSFEDQLRQAQRMEAVGQLAGGIAHDFNNVLTAILGNAGIVLETLPPDSPSREDVEEIAKAGRRAAALTHQLLAFSRKQILAPSVLHLGDIVSDLGPMLRRLIGETIDLKVVMGDRGQVKADPNQIEQVLVNLAVNARDAMPNGGHLTIETADVLLGNDYAREHASVRPGAYVMIGVSDSGHGMDAATQARIFEPFYTTKPKGQGTGLGLATVYGIVKQSGGHIWVYSEVDRGTTFKVYLPRTVEAVELAPASATDANVPRGSQIVLLVEDDEAVRAFVSRMLQRHGYTVYTEGTPTAAIEFATAHRGTIDLILTDVVLPVMSGRAMAIQLQDQHPEARVLYMSGYTDDAIVHHGVLDPGMAFIQKPFSAEALINKLRELLDTRPVGSQG